MTQKVNLQPYFEEIEKLLEDRYNNATVYHSDGRVSKFHVGYANIQYSTDGGKTMHDLGEHFIGDITVHDDEASPGETPFD